MGVVVMAEFKSWPDDGVTVTLAVSPASDSGTYRPTTLMTQLSKAITDKPGLSKTALRAAIRGKNDAKDLALELLVTEDYVEVRPGDRGARLHYSKRQFAVDHDGD
jgi:hypothetical protein